jgi:putative ABC transport system substrate-binding protein
MIRALAESPVLPALRRLAAGLVLIVLLSSILLISDLGHRRTASAPKANSGGRKFKAAIVYFAHGMSNDYCVNGLLDGLKASGFEEGNNLEIVRADAQGEMTNIPT